MTVQIHTETAPTTRMIADGGAYDGPTLVDALATNAAGIPDAVAVTFTSDNGGTGSLTVAELRSRVVATAARLRQCADRGDRALLLYPPGLEFVVAFLGALHAGIIAVPAAVPRRNRGEGRLRKIIDDATPALLLTVEALEPSLEKALPCEHEMMPVATDRIGMVSSERFCFEPPRPDDLAFLQYTSGSTGNPKGVMVSHGNLSANLTSARQAYRFDRSSIMASWLPLFHDMGLIGNLLAPIFVGFPTHLMSPTAFIQRPAAWLELISRVGATVAGAPNFGWDYCSRLVTAEEKSRIDLRSLVVAYNGSEPIRNATLERFSAAFAGCGFRSEAHFPCYGLAEATLFVSGGPVGSGARQLWFDSMMLENGVALVGPQRAGAQPITSCGPTWLDTQIAIVDPETFERKAPDEIGEIWVGGRSVTGGYWGRRSDAAFEGWIAGEGDGPFLRTGDLGVVIDGELFVTGRLKDMIIVRGRNIYPQDIEAVVEEIIDRAEPNGCAAVGVEGEVTESVAIVIEADRATVRLLDQHRSLGVTGSARSSPPEIGALFARITTAVAERFDLTVSEIALLRPGTFPRTTSGKVRRASCRAMLLEGDTAIIAMRSALPEESRNESLDEPMIEAPPVVDRSIELVQIQEHVLRCVREMLEHGKVPVPNDFGIDSRIAELGLDSIALAVLGAAIESATGRLVGDDLLHECETLATVALLLTSAPAKERAHPRPSETKRETGSPDIDHPRSGSGSRLPERYHHLNSRCRRWKEEGGYFFHTEIAGQSDTHIVAEGAPLLMMGSYSYLGLQTDPRLISAACDAIRDLGTGAHGARVLCGTTSLHVELERRVARLLRSEDAMVMSSGFGVNASVIPALVGPGDRVIGDAWNHASIVDGCRSSGATFSTFAHNDMGALERELIMAGDAEKLVVVDGVYSMEGDIAPLPEIVALCRRYGALLMVDEAHSLGVIGATGRGVQEHFDLDDDAIDIKMGCLSKALASSGGYIAGRGDLVDYLRHHCRGYLFSSAVPAGQIAASIAAIDILESEGAARVGHLQRLSERYRNGLRALGFDTLGSTTPIVPVSCGSEEIAIAMTSVCRREGLFVVPVFYPAVPMNASRLRTCVLASHSEADILFALDVLEGAGRECGVVG